MSFSNSNQLSADLQGLFKKNPFAPGVFNRIHEYRDNGTYADEALRIIKYVLLPISALFTLAFGWALHYNIFSAWVGTTPAHVSAAFFTLFIEISKIAIGIYTIRLIAFGMFKHGLPDAALTFCMLIIFIAAFCWSYYNSTQGVQYAAKITADWKISRKITDPTAAAAPLSKRIEETNKTATKGIDIKWKGKTTRDGQRIAANSTAAIAEQEKQKTILMQKEVDEQKRSDDHRDTFINTASGLFSNLGGKMEFFQVFLIFAMVFAEKILWHRMPEDKKTTPPHRNQNNGQKVSFQQNPIGFNTDQNGNVRSATSPPAVNGLPNTPPDDGQTLYHNVPQNRPDTGQTGADAILKNAYASIQRDIKNLENDNGRPRTVAERIHKAMMEVGREAQKPAFKPGNRMASEFYVFIRDTVYPALEARNLQMEYSKPFLEHLQQFTDDKELELIEQNKPRA